MNPFTLHNEKLVRLDERTFQYNLRFWNFYQRRLTGKLVNYAVLDRVIDENASLRLELGELPRTGLAPFETLVVRHLEANLDAQHQFLQYWFLGGIERVEVLVERVFGPGALPLLKESFRAYDFHAEARLIELESAIKPALMVPGHRGVVRTINALLPLLVREVLEAGQAKGVVPRPDLLTPEEIAVVLRTSRGARGAAWYEHSSTVELAEREFHVFRSAQRLFINPGWAMMTLAHELLGHAVNGACSTWMPLTLTGADQNLANLTSMPALEGFALEREQLGRHLVRERRGELAFEVAASDVSRRALDDEELELSLLLNETEHLERVVRGYTAWLCLRHMDDPHFDPRAALADDWSGHLSRSRHPLVAKAPVDVIPPSAEVVDFLYDLSYLLGPRLMSDTLGQVAATFGHEFLEREGRLVAHILATGTWAFPVFSDWVLFALEHRAAFLEQAQLGMAA